MTAWPDARIAAKLATQQNDAEKMSLFYPGLKQPGNENEANRQWQKTNFIIYIIFPHKKNEQKWCIVHMQISMTLWY